MPAPPESLRRNNRWLKSGNISLDHMLGFHLSAQVSSTRHSMVGDCVSMRVNLAAPVTLFVDRKGAKSEKVCI